MNRHQLGDLETRQVRRQLVARAKGVPLPSARVARAPLLMPSSLAVALLCLYDVPDPRCPRRIIRGYDRLHARRTARMCAAVALRLGHPEGRVRDYQIACLLHDLGRAGLDRELFGKIWSWARERGIPTRPREWRVVHPKTVYGKETEEFLARYRSALEADGIPLDAWATEQVEMRLGYARRLRRRVKVVKPQLHQLGVTWQPWMERVMLYYYYPERLATAPLWVKQLAEVLVACEQFEAYSNQERGRDYYVRTKERLQDAFDYLERLRNEGILSAVVVQAVQALAAAGTFDQILAEARGKVLSSAERRYLRSLRVEEAR